MWDSKLLGAVSASHLRTVIGAAWKAYETALEPDTYADDDLLFDGLQLVEGMRVWNHRLVLSLALMSHVDACNERCRGWKRVHVGGTATFAPNGPGNTSTFGYSLTDPCALELPVDCRWSPANGTIAVRQLETEAVPITTSTGRVTGTATPCNPWGVHHNPSRQP